MTLERLDRLVGRWGIEAKHPAAPGLVVRGSVDVEWLEGKRFLIHRCRLDHPDFPSSISILGMMGKDRAGPAPDSDVALRMHYHDSRGVFRVYEVSVDDEAWRIWRDAPGFSQAFRGVFADGGATIAGRWQLREGDAVWRDDLEIVYTRRS